MMGSINWIEQFFGFFQARLDFVRSNCLGSIDGIILMTTYLDALSGYRYGGKSSRERFCRFLVEYSGLAETWRKVSLRRLQDELWKRGSSYSSAASYLGSRYRLDDFAFLNLGHNPDVAAEDILLGLSENEIGIERDEFLGLVSRYEYSSILWRDYRCNAVHEVTKPREEAFNLAEKVEPFYSSGTVPMDDGTECQVVWFGIPPQFILRSLEGCLTHFRGEWEANSFDYQKMIAERLG